MHIVSPQLWNLLYEFTFRQKIKQCINLKLGFKIMKFVARFRKKFPTLSSGQFSFVGRSFAMFEDLGITVQNIAMWFPDNLSWFREFLMTCENFLIQSSVTWFRRVWWCILDIMSFNILSPWPIPVWIWIEASITESKFEISGID